MAEIKREMKHQSQKKNQKRLKLLLRVYPEESFSLVLGQGLLVSLLVE